ncbi:MAG: cysteine hydrolase family protein [Solirubrobacterales bacterium]
MENINLNSEFLTSVNATISSIVEDLNNTNNIDMDNINKDNTAVIIVDAVNGFCKEGIMYSPFVKENLPQLLGVVDKFKGYKKVFFIDTHIKNSVEFNTYPVHCIEGTSESELVDELKPYLDKDAEMCVKNSTNGFLAPEYQSWLKANKNIKNFVVCGYVTDICCLQYCLSQRAYMNQENLKGKVIAVVNAMETYDLKITNHLRELMDIFALYNMKLNGIELVRA